MSQLLREVLFERNYEELDDDQVWLLTLCLGGSRMALVVDKLEPSLLG